MPCMIASSDGDTAQWTSLAWPSDGECEDVEGRSRSAKGDESGLCNLCTKKTPRDYSLYTWCSSQPATRPAQPNPSKYKPPSLISQVPTCPASRRRRARASIARAPLAACSGGPHSARYRPLGLVGSVHAASLHAARPRPAASTAAPGRSVARAWAFRAAAPSVAGPPPPTAAPSPAA